MFRQLPKYLVRAAAVGTLGACAYVSQDEGLSHSSICNYNFSKVYERDSYTNRNKMDAGKAAARAALDKERAPYCFDTILGLDGYNMKMAQTLCGTDYLADACLLDAVPPRPFPVVQEIVEGELGSPLGDVYETYLAV